MLKIIKTIKEWQELRSNLDTRHLSIGFVPTMGNLHQGHLSLIERARKECDFVVVSIFVNPTQFNNLDDLKKYPRTIEDDLTMLKAADVDYAFVPKIEDMYPDDYRYQVHESRESRAMEGAHRPGHFDGVLTIVMKLFMLVKPAKAYFGEKDFQQLSLVKDMAKAFFLDLEVVPCATIRDEKQLALSSRNHRLTDEGRKKARFFARALNGLNDVASIENALKQEGIEIDYIVEKNQRRYGAVIIDDVRLIDNVEC